MNDYHFVKVERIESNGDSKPIWYFFPNSVDQIKEHWVKYPGSVIREGSRNMSDKIFHGIEESNPTNEFERAVRSVNAVTRKTIINDMVEIENMAYNNRINDFINGRDIYLTHGLSVVTIDSRFYHITENVYKDTLTFPDEERPSIDKVRYIQWDGGKHWYAKIGKLDVVDKDNNQKWDTKEEAETAAKWYIEKNW